MIPRLCSAKAAAGHTSAALRYSFYRLAVKQGRVGGFCDATCDRSGETAKCWSECQDLNLRPRRPEQGALLRTF